MFFALPVFKTDHFCANLTLFFEVMLLFEVMYKFDRWQPVRVASTRKTKKGLRRHLHLVFVIKCQLLNRAKCFLFLVQHQRNNCHDQHRFVPLTFKNTMDVQRQQKLVCTTYLLLLFSIANNFSSHTNTHAHFATFFKMLNHNHSFCGRKITSHWLWTLHIKVHVIYNAVDWRFHKISNNWKCTDAVLTIVNIERN